MEALERNHVAGLLLVLLCGTCMVQSQRTNSRMSYVCPPNFVRLGHSCYFFSEKNATWHNALFDCKDRDSNLSVPARWEDRNLRQYLNKNDVEKAVRWIGGIYDDAAQAWKWGGELRQMHYQSFSKMKKMSPEQLKFHCIAMIPERLYSAHNKTGKRTTKGKNATRWAPHLCFESHRYICQTKLRKVTKARVKDLSRRWQLMGVINEIKAPTLSREVDTMVNDVTVNPYPKSNALRPGQGYQRQGRRGRKQNRNYLLTNDVRPNDLRKRSRPTAHSRLTRPFKGYTWNRRDPEGSFERNAALLRSGQTGLSAQQIKAHLARLTHLRDKQIARRKRLREREDWLVNEPKQDLTQTHARTYMVDNNISALHPKTIVEEFDLFPPPQPPVAVAVQRPARATG